MAGQIKEAGKYPLIAATATKIDEYGLEVLAPAFFELKILDKTYKRKSVREALEKAFNVMAEQETYITFSIEAVNYFYIGGRAKREDNYTGDKTYTKGKSSITTQNGNASATRACCLFQWIKPEIADAVEEVVDDWAKANCRAAQKILALKRRHEHRYHIRLEKNAELNPWNVKTQSILEGLVIDGRIINRHGNPSENAQETVDAVPTDDGDDNELDSEYWIVDETTAKPKIEMTKAEGTTKYTVSMVLGGGNHRAGSDSKYDDVTKEFKTLKGAVEAMIKAKIAQFLGNHYGQKRPVESATLTDASGEVLISYGHKIVGNGTWAGYDKFETLEIAESVQAEVEAIADKWAERNADTVKTYEAKFARYVPAERHYLEARFMHWQYEKAKAEKAAIYAAIAAAVIEDVEANDDEDEEEIISAAPVTESDDDDDELDDARIDALAATKETTAIVAVAGTEYTYSDDRYRRPIAFEIDDFNHGAGTFAVDTVHSTGFTCYIASPARFAQVAYDRWNFP